MPISSSIPINQYHVTSANSVTVKASENNSKTDNHIQKAKENIVQVYTKSSDADKNLTYQDMRVNIPAETNIKNTREIVRLTNSFDSWKTGYIKGGVSQDRVTELTDNRDKFVAIMKRP